MYVCCLFVCLFNVALINEIESARMKHEYHLNDIKAQIAEVKSSLEQIEKNQERKIAEIMLGNFFIFFFFMFFYCHEVI